MRKKDLIDILEIYLETMCDCITIGNKDFFRYYAGKAEAIRIILVKWYWWDVERDASEHIKNMWELMEKNW